MPQLDKVTFFSQFFWLCFFYLGFYYTVVKYFLPQISRILKLRQEKINLSQYGSSSLQQENHQVGENLGNILSRDFSLSKNVFIDYLYRTTSWLNQSLTSGNKTQYTTGNNSYIHSVGKDSLSQNIGLYYTSTPKPEYLKASELIDYIRKLKKTQATVNPIEKQQIIKKQHTVQKKPKTQTKVSGSVPLSNKKPKKTRKD